MTDDEDKFAETCFSDGAAAMETRITADPRTTAASPDSRALDVSLPAHLQPSLATRVAGVLLSNFLSALIGALIALMFLLVALVLAFLIWFMVWLVRGP